MTSRLNIKLSHLALCLMIFCLLGSCATYIAYTPHLQESSRGDINLESPILISMLDGRVEKPESDELVLSLKQELSNVYGKSIKWVSYFDSKRKGNVFINLRIKKMGADFGNRFVSSSIVASQKFDAQARSTNGWKTIVASVDSQKNLFAAGFSCEGWWIGTAWIDVEIYDDRMDKAVNILIPLVAEHNESNLWGYKSAEEASKRAWQKIAPDLIQLLDMTIIQIKDEENL